MEAATRAYKSLLFETETPPTATNRPAFAKAMLEASVDCIKVISTEGTLLSMNKAGCLALGVELDSDFGMPWLPLLPREVQQAGEVALAEARLRKSARFPGRSELDGEIRYWDNLLTPIVDDGGIVQCILCVSRDVTSKTVLEKRLEEAIQREKLLAQEMRHRVKNVYSIISGLIKMAEHEAAAGDGLSPTGILRGKLGALSRASDVVFSDSGASGSTDPRTDFAELVRQVMRPYEGRFEIEGGPVTVSNQDVTTLALFLHEMATNSIKYGAFASGDGRVKISSRVTDTGLHLGWFEDGNPQMGETPGRQGFGSEMIQRMVKAIGGTFHREWTEGKMRADLFIPK